MSRLRSIIPVLFAIFSFQCKPVHNNKTVDVNTNEFPPMEMLGPASGTRFVPVLEKAGEKGKNIIYAASFALAWDELIQKIGKPESVESEELTLIGQSDSYKGALDSDRFVRDAQIKGNTIAVNAGFGGSLTFAVPMDSLLDGYFNGQHVRAFGMSGYSDNIAGEMGIPYYENDDKFIIKIYPEQENDEIILAKGFSQSAQLSTILDSIYTAIETGEKIDTASTSEWKHIFYDSDEVVIPVVRFNFGNKFKGIESTHFKVSGNIHTIAEAYQRTALVLNERGTKIESEARIIDTMAAIMDDPEKPAAKHLLFDKPFVVILKKRSKRNPYFMMKVENTELMEKFTARSNN